MSEARPPIEAKTQAVPLRTLVVGGGSIGARHLKNLAGAGVAPLALVDPLKERRSSLCVPTAPLRYSRQSNKACRGGRS